MFYIVQIQNQPRAYCSAESAISVYWDSTVVVKNICMHISCEHWNVLFPGSLCTTWMSLIVNIVDARVSLFTHSRFTCPRQYTCHSHNVQTWSAMLRIRQQITRPHKFLFVVQWYLLNANESTMCIFLCFPFVPNAMMVPLYIL